MAGFQVTPEAVQAAIVQPGLVSRIWSNDHQEQFLRFSQSAGINQHLLNDLKTPDAITNFYVGFSEQYQNVFKTRAQERGTGRATGTRFKAVFNNIPENVRIFVTTRDVPSSGDPFVRAALVPTEMDESEPNANLPPGTGVAAGGIPIQEMMITQGAATAVWEWVRNRPNSSATPDEVHFGVVLAMQAGTASMGTATVNASFAPTSLVTMASDTSPIPRFADTSRAVRAFTIGP